MLVLDMMSRNRLVLEVLKRLQTLDLETTQSLAVSINKVNWCHNSEESYRKR